MHESLFNTVRTNFNYEIKNTRAGAELPNREDRDEESSGTDPVMERTETPSIAEGKSDFDNVVPNYTVLESIVAEQIFHISEPLLHSVEDLCLC